MTRQTLSSLLFIAAIALLILALATLIPHSSRMVSDLGYYTFCPFAPYSTLTLLFLAGLGWVVRRHIDAQQPQ
jgi:hypothetical protein